MRVYATVRTRFTIAIPTHNRRETVLLAARSALAQTRPPEQIIVLCDGCDDGTAEAVRSLGSPLTDAIELPKAPGYAYGHRNRSLELARGEVILWLADDDLLLPDHLERIGALWDCGRLDLVQSDAVLVRADDSLGWFGGDWSTRQGRAQLATMNTNPMASVSVRVDVALAAGGWNDTLPRAADWDLWQRVVQRGARTARSPEPTVLHFRATGRGQPWDDRVRQNTSWLARMADPGGLDQMRLTLKASALGAELERVRAELATAQRELTTVRRDLAMARLEGATATYRAQELGGRLARAETQAGAHAETLSRIYAGRWWRLRGVLVGLRARVRRWR